MENLDLGRKREISRVRAFGAGSYFVSTIGLDE